MALYAKFGALFLKTLAKPLATRIKSSAKNHPLFRRQLVRLAQGMHQLRTEVTSALRPEGSPKVFAGKLNEEVALAQGTDLLGEIVVFGVAGGILVWEVQKNSAKEAAKEQKKQEARLKKEENRQLLNRQTEQRLAHLEHTLGELMARIEAIEQRSSSSSSSSRSRWFSMNLF